MEGQERVDLTNCDREPIHIPGSIQPIGFLVALTSDWLIARVSANVGEFLGQHPEELLGKPLADIFPSKAVHDLRNRTTMLRGQDAVERLFQAELVAGGTLFDVAVHLSQGQVVIEAEPSAGQHGDASSLVRSMISRLDQSLDFTTFFREGARQVRGLTDFDRVMVYRFAPDGSGEVVGEACKAGIGRFIGLHYPASDIPAQARELYKRNLLRVITDVNAAPVPLVPQRDQAGRPLDLSLSMLRSVSPIHIEYLKNMGVGASMSISIIVEGRLWGLFACHHYSARCPTFERRAICELFAQMFSMRLEGRERQQTVEYERRARDISDQMLGAVASNETLLKDPDWLADILTSAIPADGVGVWIAGSYAFSGVTPQTDEFRRIVRALNGTAAGKVFATDDIKSLLDTTNASSTVAGLLSIPISRSPRDYVVLFRSEMVRSVRWGGDPHKPVQLGPNGPRLTPRESFEEWKELVQGKSTPFTPSEMRVAETLRATLIEVVLRLADEASAERQQASARQELLIAELNHRVRNILGVIRGLVRQSHQPDDEAVREFAKVVDGRIHALARAHNQITDDHWGPAPMQALIDAEAAAFIGETQRLVSEGTPVLLNPQAYSTMALLVHELITNSTKYGCLSVPEGRARISWTRNDAKDLLVDWTESGGPPVKKPQRKGFGTTIIERSIPYDLGGAATIDYAPAGLRASFRIPARHVAEPKGYVGPTLRFPRTSPGHPQPPPYRMLAGHQVLLVEDSLIIALDAEDIASRLGADSVSTAASVEAALDIIDTKRPTVAMLDINLGDRNSFPIAYRLDDLGVPFLFATGYGEQAKLPMEHRNRLVVQKPYTLENVARAMHELVGDARKNGNGNGNPH